MPRIACLLVPDLPIAAACRADPDLAGRPLALSAGTGTHAPIVAAAAAARARGVRVGHTVAQSLAIAADLVVRPRDETAERSAVRALVDVAASLASRIEAAADGAVFLDAAGATHLVPSEAGLAPALVARAARVGLAARAAVGGSMTVARLAALHGGEVVPAGTELGFLAPLPLARLAPPPEIAATLERWGIRRLGHLARLPVAEVVARLGPAGAALVRAARGSLEARRPRAGAGRGAPAAAPGRLGAAQLGRFSPAGPSPERLATTLARLAALCGPERVGAPAVLDSHRPGAAAVAPFTLGAAPEPPPLTGCRLVVRALRPPRPVEVFADRGRPDFVRGEGLGGRVVGAAGPWRGVGEWWSDGAFARDYYDLELSDGGLYRCYRDDGRWFVDGVYD